MGIELRSLWRRLQASKPTAAMAFLGGFSLPGNGPDDAQGLLLRYMERGQYVTMRAIIEQRSHLNSRRPVQIKVEQDGKGRRKTTVLQPLGMQGIQSLDDGRKWLNYQPDENRIYVQESPSLHSEDPRARLALASQNYVFRVERGPTIAGRLAVVVVAVPRSPEMPTRRYSIESSKSVLLRLEVELSSGERREIVDTKAISFPTSIPNATFEIKPVGDVRVIELPSPKRMTRAEVAQAAGIQPIVPDDLPFGFVARAPELTGNDDCRMVAVRITDGLAYATVYQWKDDDGRTGRQRGSDGKERGPETVLAGGIRLRCAGDLPDQVRQRILSAFSRSADRFTLGLLEPTERGRSLNETPRESGADRDQASSGQARTTDGPKGSDPFVSLLILLLGSLGDSRETI